MNPFDNIFSLSGKTALVVGASRGIGWAIVSVILLAFGISGHAFAGLLQFDEFINLKALRIENRPAGVRHADQDGLLRGEKAGGMPTTTISAMCRPSIRL